LEDLGEDREIILKINLQEIRWRDTINLACDADKYRAASNRLTDFRIPETQREKFLTD
jgi:hypothetical protein